MHTSDVTVLSTDLARTDRRALSEAWYGTLHLAQSAERGSASRSSKAASSDGGAHRAKGVAPAGNTSRRDTPSTRGAMRRVAPGAVRGDDAGAQANERRANVSPLARRLERALTSRDSRAALTSITVRAGAGRILVMVRGDGARTRVIAVCAPALRERVERALAHARFVLAAGPVRVEAA